MLNDATLPATFRSADQASLRGQALTVRAIKWSLAFVVMAAVLGTLSDTEELKEMTLNLGAAIASAAFVISLMLTTGLEKSRYQERWFAGRAVAESARSLAWRYAAGGDPFPLTDETADAAFAQQIAEARTRAHGLFTHGAGEEITAAMRDARALPLEQRRQQYLTNRIDDQIGWYSSKSELNGRKATRWRRIGGAANGVGIAAATIQIFENLPLDILGVAAAAAGAATAWTQTRQHVVLQAAYGDAAIDLANARERLAREMTEAEWAEEVGTAEEAISREHTMWIARTSSIALGGP